MTKDLAHRHPHDTTQHAPCCVCSTTRLRCPWATLPPTPISITDRYEASPHSTAQHSTARQHSTA
ncbi:hypothetical protein E2C01_019250 [Portunus trituberculatus]|uniref:Uncharacterized protein n=1 Tax=Portunus trituberculatus TaxID=210409 RepID=A0A5B7DXD5_PORTR|nr:hypothetical protein [Portunus trituberculatus]